MDTELIKFITDLGSIGAICYVVYLFVRFMTEEQQRQIEVQKAFLETISQFSNNKQDIENEK